MTDQFKKIMADLRQGNYAPVYFLCGSEPFYIDRVSEYIESNAIEESEKDFNQSILYGLDTDSSTVRAAVNRYPMMAEKQVVILKEGQHLKNIAELEPLIDKPVPSTIFVINYKGKKPDRRKSFGKKVSKQPGFLLSEKLYDSRIPQWIKAQAAEKNLKTDEKTTTILAEHLGNDLSKIDNELEKLRIILPAGSSITPGIIEKNIGISKDYNVFELQAALSGNDDEKLFRIAFYFGQNPKKHPLIQVFGVLFSYFMKVMRVHRAPNAGDKNSLARFIGVNPYFVGEYRQAAKRFSVNRIAEVVSLIREYDLKAKGVNSLSASEGDLLTEFLVKLQRTR